MKKQFLSMLFVSAMFLCGADAPSGVPAGSQEVSPGVYRFVDKDKKVWIYRKTPFGFQKSAEEATRKSDERERAAPENTPPAPDPNRTATPFGESKPSAAGMPQTTVTEVGDTLRFERPSPFGPYRWTRKKTELTDEEKKLWEAQRSTPRQADGK
jgi:hypothetical protein